MLIGPLKRRDAFLIALVSGIGEEALFRGVLQPAVGIWFAAAIFAALHIGPNSRFVAWPEMAMFAGVVFGSLTLWFGSVLPAMVAHATVNYCNLVYLADRDTTLGSIEWGTVGGEGAAGS